MTALLIVLASVAAMEVVAAVAHRYVMHGFGWRLHRSHHEPRAGLFEANDLYAVGFALIAVALFAVGAFIAPWLFWVATGVTLYGLLYFVVHDGLVHRRWPFRAKPRHPYLRRLVQAHRLHHATRGRDGAVSFGFLYAPPVRLLTQRLRAASSEKRGRPEVARPAPSPVE